MRINTFHGDPRPYLSGFLSGFRQEGANVTIVELREGMYYCCIFQGFCHRGNYLIVQLFNSAKRSLKTAFAINKGKLSTCAMHTVKLGGSEGAPQKNIDICSL